MKPGTCRSCPPRSCPVDTAPQPGQCSHVHHCTMMPPSTRYHHVVKRCCRSSKDFSTEVMDDGMWTKSKDSQRSWGPVAGHGPGAGTGRGRVLGPLLTGSPRRVHTLVLLQVDGHSAITLKHFPLNMEEVRHILLLGKKPTSSPESHLSQNKYPSPPSICTLENKCLIHEEKK